MFRFLAVGGINIAIAVLTFAPPREVSGFVTVPDVNRLRPTTSSSNVMIVGKRSLDTLVGVRATKKRDRTIQRKRATASIIKIPPVGIRCVRFFCFFIRR
jgi:hypothetical protein